MISLFSSKKTETIDSVWRIDSSGVSVIVIRSGQIQSVIYYDYQPLLISVSDTRHGYQQLLDGVLRTMTSMIPNLQSALGLFPVTCHVVLGEPWSHMIKRKVIYKRKAPFTVTKKLLSDLIARDMKKGGLVKNHNQIIHTDHSAPMIGRVYISGHARDDYYQKQVTDVRVEYTTGFFDREIVGIITKILHEETKVKLLDISFAHYQSILIDFWNTIPVHSSIIIDPSGKITDLYLFHNGTLAQWGTLPIGLWDIEKKITESLGISNTELRTLFSLQADNILDDRTLLKLNRAIDTVMAAWENDFQQFSASAVEQGVIIEQVIWMGDMHDRLMQLLIQLIKENTAAYPILFGTTQVGFVHGDNFLLMNPQPYVYNFTMQSQDVMVLSKYFT